MLALCAMASDDAFAQSSLPPVTVDSPQQSARRAQPSPRAARSRTTVRRAAPAQTAQPAEPAAGLGRGGVEKGTGPVVGYLAHQSVTSTKTDTPLLETPQSVSVVTRDQMVAQGARNVSQALEYTPGVTPLSFGPNAFFDSFKVRGFDAPRYLDGLRLPSDITTFAAPRIETYGLERLEVLKGPSSGLYGASDPGGIINMISKRPQDTPHYSVEGSIGNFNRYEGAFDIGGPVDKSGELLYRIVGLGRKSDTEVNFVQDNKIFIAPSLTWRPTSNTSFTILSHYQKIDNAGYQQYVPGQFALPNYPGPRISRSTYIGEPGAGDGFKLEQAAIGYAFEHRFNNNLQFRQNFRYTTVTQDLQSVRSEGAVGTQVLRSYNYVRANAKNVALDNQMQADFMTGPLTHKVLMGFDYTRLTAASDYRADYSLPPIDAFNPVYGATPLPWASLLSFIKRDDVQSQAGFYLQDQIKLDRFTLTLSGRRDLATTAFTSAGFYPVAGNYERSDAAQTGRVGLNYLFDFGLSPYATYSTSFTPNLGADATGQTFKPTTGDNVEIGVKYQPVGMNLMLTAALFDTRQQNVLTGNPLNPFFNVQTDSMRVRGFEFEAKGNITREMEIVAGYSLLDPKVTASVLPANVGKDMMNTARQQASLWGKYTFFDGPVAGLGLGAGVRYVGETYGAAANTLQVPSYTLFDAAVSYDFGYMQPNLRGLTAQINARNLTDRYYVASCFTGLAYCTLGTGRTVIGTLKYSWN